MSKTTPVRWWRDDATRYQRRPLFGVCRSWKQPPAELLRDLVARPVDPEFQRAISAFFESTRPERLYAASAIPAELVNAPYDTRPAGLAAELSDRWGVRAMREGRSCADPVADIRAFVEAQRREIDNINRSKS